MDTCFWLQCCMLHNDPLVCMRKDPEWVRIIRAILLRIWAFVTGHLLFLYEKKEYIEPCKKKKKSFIIDAPDFKISITFNYMLPNHNSICFILYGLSNLDIYICTGRAWLMYRSSSVKFCNFLKHTLSFSFQCILFPFKALYNDAIKGYSAGFFLTFIASQVFLHPFPHFFNNPHRFFHLKTFKEAFSLITVHL